MNELIIHKYKLKGKEEVKQQDFFSSSPLLARHSSHILKSSQFQSALFSAHFLVVCHSKSAHESPSTAIHGKRRMAKPNSHEMPLQAPVHPLGTCIHHFVGPAHWLRKSIVFSCSYSDLSISHLHVFSGCQLGKAILMTLRVRGPQCLQTNKNTPMLPSAAGCYTSPTSCPCCLLIFQSPFAA